jgi:hypothetical protein
MVDGHVSSVTANDIKSGTSGIGVCATNDTLIIAKTFYNAQGLLVQ